MQQHHAQLYFTTHIQTTQHTTPPTTRTLMEVREVRDATLVATATIMSSWLMTAVPLLGGAVMDGGPEEGVSAMGSAGREPWATARGGGFKNRTFLFCVYVSVYAAPKVASVPDIKHRNMNQTRVRQHPPKKAACTWSFWSTRLSALCALTDPRKRWTNTVQPSENWNSMFSWKSLQSVAQFKS